MSLCMGFGRAFQFAQAVGEVLLELAEWCAQGCVAGDNNIAAGADGLASFEIVLQQGAQAAFDAVAFHGIAAFFANGESENGWFGCG